MLYNPNEYEKFRNVIYGKNKVDLPRYPYNLYLDVEPYHKRQRTSYHEAHLGLNTDLPYGDDIIEGLTFAVNKLPPMPRMAVVSIYINEKTKTQTARDMYPDESLKTAIGHVNASLKRAFSDLVKPPLIGYIKYGKNGYDQIIKRQQNSDCSKDTLPIERAGLSTRVTNALKRGHIDTKGMLIYIVENAPEKLDMIPGIGTTAKREINKMLTNNN